MRRVGGRLLAVMLVLAGTAHAHQSGNSECELTVQADGHVQGRIALAARELAALAPVDPDGDGRIEAREIEAARPHFEKLALGLIEVHADGKECPATLQNLVLGDQNDGVDLFVDYACPNRPKLVEVQALMLSALPLSHRHALTLRAGSVVERAALGGPARRAAIHTPFPSAARSAAWIALGVLSLGLLALALRRRAKAP